MNDLQYFIDHGGGKKIYFDEVRYFLYLLASTFFTISLNHRTAGHPLTKGSRILNLKARRQLLASATNRLIINSLTSAASILKPLSGVALAGLLTSTRTVKSPAMEFTRLPER